MRVAERARASHLDEAEFSVDLDLVVHIRQRVPVVSDGSLPPLAQLVQHVLCGSDASSFSGDPKGRVAQAPLYLRRAREPLRAVA